MKDTFDRKELEHLLETIERYRDNVLDFYYEYRSRGPEWQEAADRECGEATGYEIVMVKLRRMLRGEEI